MSATPQTAIPTRIEDRWLDLDEAARRAGYSGPGPLRNRIRAGGFRPEQTRKVARDGVCRWEIREDADPRFLLIKSPEALRATRYQSSTAAQRAVADRRKLIIDGWDAACANQPSRDLATAQYIEHLDLDRGVKLCPDTLYKWRARFRRHGLDGLLDGRAVRESAAQRASQDDPFIEYALRCYMGGQRRGLEHCHDLATAMAIEKGWRTWSLKTLERIKDSIDPRTILLYRRGKKAFEDQCEPSILRDYYSIQSNDIWCSDHHQFDVLVQIGEKLDKSTGEVTPILARPWITAWQDLRSRKIVGHYIYAEPVHASSDTILKAFVPAVLEHGLPGQVLMDNGRDYRGKVLSGMNESEKRRCVGVFAMLNIDARHAWKEHGQSKPIERNFGTVCSRFSKGFETYTGRNPMEKPQGLPKRLVAAPTLDEFRAAFASWLSGDYHAHAHSGHAMDGLSPGEAWSRHLLVRRDCPREILLYTCLPRIRPVRKQRDGSTVEGFRVSKEGINYKGLYFGGFDAQVQSLWGQRCQIAVDNDDLSGVFIESLDGRLICWTACTSRMPWNAGKEELSAAIAEKKRVYKACRDYLDARPRMALDLPALMHAQAAQAQATAAAKAPDPEQPPPSIQPHRTHFDEQLPQIREALERPAKIAVGAESFSYGPHAPAAPSAKRFRFEPMDHADGAEEESAESSRSMAYASAPAGDEPAPERFHYSPSTVEET